jgi:hypothetical protein
MKFYINIYEIIEDLWYSEDKTKIVEIIKIFRYTMIPLFFICLFIPFNIIVAFGLWGGLIVGHPKLTEIKTIMIPHVI